MSCCIVRKVGYQRRRIKSERDEGKGEGSAGVRHRPREHWRCKGLAVDARRLQLPAPLRHVRPASSALIGHRRAAPLLGTAKRQRRRPTARCGLPQCHASAAGNNCHPSSTFSVVSVWPTLCFLFHHAGFAELSVNMQAMMFTFSFNHSLTRIRRHQCGISASWVPRIEGKIALPGPRHNTKRQAPDRTRCTHGCDVIPKVALLRDIAFLTTSRGSNGREYRKPSAMRWNNLPSHD